MNPDLRRIVAVEAHRRRSGRCPVRVHSLGTGETFEIKPSVDGFLDVATGMAVRSDGREIVLPDGTIDLAMTGDVLFEGHARESGERFTGRAGGGSSVTLYEGGDYFQYAVIADGDFT